MFVINKWLNDAFEEYTKKWTAFSVHFMKLPYFDKQPEIMESQKAHQISRRLLLTRKKQEVWSIERPLSSSSDRALQTTPIIKRAFSKKVES